MIQSPCSVAFAQLHAFRLVPGAGSFHLQRLTIRDRSKQSDREQIVADECVLCLPGEVLKRKWTWCHNTHELRDLDHAVEEDDAMSTIFLLPDHEAGGAIPATQVGGNEHADKLL